MVELSSVRQNLMDVADEAVTKWPVKYPTRSNQKAGPAGTRSLRSDRIRKHGFASSAAARDVDRAGSRLAKCKRLCGVEDDHYRPATLKSLSLPPRRVLCRICTHFRHAPERATTDFCDLNQK
jgi:hypothetical protein